MPWKIIALAMTPPTSKVENPSAARPVPPTPWPIFGNTYVNTKISSSGCMIVRPRNIRTSLRNTVRSRSSNAAKASRLACAVGFASVSRIALSITELLPGEADEHGLERGFSHREVVDIDARALGGGEDAREHPASISAKAHEHSAGGRRRPGDTVDPGQHRQQLLGVTRRVHGHDRVRIDRALQPAGRVEGED